MFVSTKPKIYGPITLGAKIQLTRRVSFSAMHNLARTEMSEAQNKQIFGKCCNLHGHDYFVEATLEGTIDANTGLCCDRDAFEDVLNVEIKKRFDGHNLNLIFKSTTGEDLAREFFKLLEVKLRPAKLVRLRVQETPKNFFTWTP